MTNNTIKNIIDSIESNKSFILEAWAWSWKTYTLVESIRYIIKEKWDMFLSKWQKIACITYTNVAKDEMIERLEYSDLVEINTIHEFLWSLIEWYQTNLKKEVLELNSSLDSDKRNDNLENIIEDLTVTYWKYWRKLEKWDIWHDDVINFSINMLRKYDKLKLILIKKYPIIFIDEYQDTNSDIVNVLLNIVDWNEDKFLLWFFWDSMQKIYQNNTIWKLENSKLEVIQKTENYRSWKKIVDLVNTIRERYDWLKQIPIKQFDWDIHFYYSNTLTVEDKYKKVIEQLNWEFDTNPIENKILVLTNKKISDDLWFRWLLDIFWERYGQHASDVLKEWDEPYINLLLNKVENIIYHYNNKNYTALFDLFWSNDFKINKLSDKKLLRDLIKTLEEKRLTENVENILKFVFENKLLSKTDGIKRFEEYLLKDFSDDNDKLIRQEKSKKLKDDLFNLQYSNILEYYKYREDKTPYSTQHWTKWAEYDNVLVVIDDSHKWYIYRWFNKLVSWEKLNKDEEKHLVAEERLLNLLYVSLSRAKKNLVVLYLSDLDLAWLNWWKGIFWDDNVSDIKTI